MTPYQHLANRINKKYQILLQIGRVSIMYESIFINVCVFVWILGHDRKCFNFLSFSVFVKNVKAMSLNFGGLALSSTCCEDMVSFYVKDVSPGNKASVRQIKHVFCSVDINQSELKISILMLFHQFKKNIKCWHTT